MGMSLLRISRPERRDRLLLGMASPQSMFGTAGRAERFAFTQFFSLCLAESPAVSIFSRPRTAFQVFRRLRALSSGTMATHSVGLGVGAFFGSRRTAAIDFARSSSSSSRFSSAAAIPG